MDFREALHLPNVRGPDADPADPDELPRQRRGITPQMHGRYPEWNVLDEADHWDEETRKLVVGRVESPPSIRFFTPAEADTLKAFCDTVVHQRRDPRIPVLSFVDEKFYEGKLDGYQYEDLPDDRELWRLVARGLDWIAHSEWRSESFAHAPESVQDGIVAAFAEGRLRGGVWDGLDVSRAWSVVTRAILAAFYSHPWSWNEIGFAGPAYPRGFAAFGSDHLEDRERWEPREAVAPDPVRE